MARILVVDDDSTFCIMLRSFLTRNGHEVEQAFSFEEALKIFKGADFDLVLSDYRLPDRTGLDLLREVKGVRPQVGVIIMTGYADIRMAVQAVKMGAYDYVAKPINPDEILLAITNLLASKTESNPQRRKLAPSGANSQSFIQGISKEALEVSDMVKLVAPTNLSVIILGDSGTGKEFVARRIHAESSRAQRPFVAIDCGALSKDLALSEFFGHVKGSFTGAVSDKTGQFEEANGGTLFLDEIGNLSYQVQINLLRAIQERMIKPIGSSREVKVDVRIIVASNEDLVDAVRKGSFREDLFHRLNEFSISVAPLRDRLIDLPLFASKFLELANSELGKNIKGFEDAVLESFSSYSWPGNIRELRNVIRRAALIEQTSRLTVKSLPYEIVYAKRLPIEDPEGSAKPDNLKDIKDKAESDLIIETLKRVRYNKSKAAQILNIDRKTLYNKMRQLGIDL